MITNYGHTMIDIQITILKYLMRARTRKLGRKRRIYEIHCV